jgi:2-hydroxycyclohexanecarboxyl-CoA dehydrogenase
MKGRAALVCGDAGGSGVAAAEALAARGALVALAVDRAGTKRATRVAGIEVVLIDVRDRSSVCAAVAAAQAACGPLEILVNCTDDVTEGPFLETGDADWRAVVQDGMFGVFRVTQVVVPGMIERGSGRVVNVVFDGGRTGAATQAIASGCAGGVIAFTKTLARELARHAITANTVCYGPLELPSGTAEAAGAGEARSRAIPVRRLGKPAEVAAAVVFLASDEAGFVTGQTLSVNGGLSMA